MINKNLIKGHILSIVGGLIAITSVFLPWFIATSNNGTSMHVNGLGVREGTGMILGLMPESFDWTFQGIGVLFLGIVAILIGVIGMVIAFVLNKTNVQSMAMAICGILIIIGGVVNFMTIEPLSGNIMGEIINAGVGYGLYFVVVSGIIVIIGGIMIWLETKKEK